VSDCPNVFYYRRNEVVNTDQYMFEDTVNWGNHSNIGGGRSVFMAATRVLFLLGIRKLYLLGVDFYMDKNTHYHFPQHRNNGSIRGNMSTYDSMVKWFGDLKPIFDELGFEVYNCNPESRLTVFPHVSFDDAINDATAKLPPVEKEATDGMYTRQAEKEKKEKQRAAKAIARKYTDDDRKEIKIKLDEKRKELDKAKEAVYQYCIGIYPEYSGELYNWAHKLKQPATDFLAKMVDDVKEAVENNTKPDDEVLAGLYECKINEKKVREDFKAAEAKKNEIWGIVK